VRTHPVNKLLEQHCYKSAAGLLQLVRFYVCSTDVINPTERERSNGCTQVNEQVNLVVVGELCV
jgi:hypothetical protein